MDTERLVPVAISIPKVYRDWLRRMITESNLKNPDEVTSLSELEREIIAGYLNELKKNGQKTIKMNNTAVITNRKEFIDAAREFLGIIF